MAQMLRHKETGELFIYTDLYARLPELELVVDDPVKEVIAEVAKKDAAIAAVVKEEKAVDKTAQKHKHSVVGD